ncbi:MAG: hypothetical protein ACK4SQ_06280 [Allorhizobium sp.]
MIDFSLANLFRRLRAWRKRLRYFPGSSSYWESRYARGGNSGAGSYDRLAEFKARVINEFVRENAIDSVIEFGCGDGNQLTLAKYPQYIGFDVSKTAVARCRELFAGDESKKFLMVDEFEAHIADLSLSLDVVYHLVEDDVFRGYMNNLFAASSRYVCIYSSNKDEWQEPHVRHRKFTEWVEENSRDWVCFKKIDNEYPFDANRKRDTSFADFYFFRKVG